MCGSNARTVSGAIRKLHKELAIIDPSEFQNTFDAHDSRTMDAEKLSWVELLLHWIHRFAPEMRTPTNVQFRIVSSCTDPIHLFGKHNLNAGAGARREAREYFSESRPSICKIRPAI
jgi:hypothetical protein